MADAQLREANDALAGFGFGMESEPTQTQEVVQGESSEESEESDNQEQVDASDDESSDDNEESSEEESGEETGEVQKLKHKLESAERQKKEFQSRADAVEHQYRNMFDEFQELKQQDSLTNIVGFEGLSDEDYIEVSKAKEVFQKEAKTLIENTQQQESQKRSQWVGSQTDIIDVNDYIKTNSVDLAKFGGDEVAAYYGVREQMRSVSVEDALKADSKPKSKKKTKMPPTGNKGQGAPTRQENMSVFERQMMNFANKKGLPLKISSSSR